MADIELVIKMPEEEYKNICLMSKDGIGMALYDWIANGTPLPKGHGRLIDASYLLNLLKCEEYENCTWKNCSDCIQEKCIRKHNILEAFAIIEADKEQEDGKV